MGAITDHMKKNAKKTPGSAHLNFTMAGLVGIGGVVGFVKAKSVPSLVAGIGVASLFGASGWLIKEGQNTNGHGLASVTSVALVAGMLPRALQSRPVPVLVSLLGVGSLIYNAKKTMDWMDSE
jgi:uncharacterized membrane protein (UPF0136 family)